MRAAHAVSLALAILLCGLLAPGATVSGQPSRICPGILAMTVQNQILKVPLCGSSGLEGGAPAAERAVVLIHGIERNAVELYDAVAGAAKSAGRADLGTIILAPQFLTREDITRHHLGTGYAQWASGGWAIGDLSRPGETDAQPQRLSSFSVADAIVDRLLNRRAFPHLKRIVVAGHSAGGQFVNRFAAGNQKEPSGRGSGVTFRYVVANPSSYLYFSERRRTGGGLNQFAIPDGGTVAACPTYNTYRYGLIGLNEYMASTGPGRIKDQYEGREVVYLLGSRDTEPNHPFLDRSCPALLQGSYRLERGLVYFNYLQFTFGSGLLNRHRLAVIPDVGHDSARMFGSACGVRYLLEDLSMGCRN